MSETRCQYVFTKGKRQGQQCPEEARTGDYCLGCSGKKSTLPKCQYVFTKGNQKDQRCTKTAIVGNFCLPCSRKKVNQEKSPVGTLIEQKVREIEDLAEDLLVIGEEEDQSNAEFRRAMADRLLASKIISLGQKKYKDAGTELERLAQQVGVNVNVAPGESVSYSDGGLTFTKRVAKSRKFIDHDIFCSELVKLGVSQQVIGKALQNSTTDRNPASYVKVSYS